MITKLSLEYSSRPKPNHFQYLMSILIFLSLGGVRAEDMMDPGQPPLLPGSLHPLDAQQFEPMGIDPIQFDYNSQIMQSMDSPNFTGLADYNQQVNGRKRKQNDHARDSNSGPFGLEVKIRLRLLRSMNFFCF